MIQTEPALSCPPRAAKHSAVASGDPSSSRPSTAAPAEQSNSTSLPPTPAGEGFGGAPPVLRAPARMTPAFTGMTVFLERRRPRDPRIIGGEHSGRAGAAQSKWIQGSAALVSSTPPTWRFPFLGDDGGAANDLREDGHTRDVADSFL